MRTLLIAGAALVLTAQVAAAQTAKPGPAPKPTPAPAATSTTPSQMSKFMLFFDWDKYNLTPDAQKVVAQAAEEYKKSGAVRINVTGFTDTSGSAEYNQALSERRANTVKNELVRLGVPAAQIVAIGRGQNDLLVPTADGVREAQNRRVEIVFPKAAPPAPPPVAAVVPPPPPPPLKWSASLGPWYGFNLKETDRGSDKTASLVGGDLAIDYRFTPNWSAGVDIAGFNTVGTSSQDGWGGFAALNVRHIFDWGSPFKPFIGPHIGYIGGSGVQDSPYAGPEVGATFDVSDKMFIYGKAGYDVLFLRESWDNGIPNGGLGAGLRF